MSLPFLPKLLSLSKMVSAYLTSPFSETKHNTKDLGKYLNILVMGYLKLLKLTSSSSETSLKPYYKVTIIRARGFALSIFFLLRVGYTFCLQPPGAKGGEVGVRRTYLSPFSFWIKF